MKEILLFSILLFTGTILFGQSRSSDNYRSTRDAVEAIQVYPNPATNYIGISAANQEVERVVIFNLVGREMKNFDAESNDKFYVGDLPKGMYLVQLLNEDKKIIKTQRVNKR